MNAYEKQSPPLHYRDGPPPGPPSQYHHIQHPISHPPQSHVQQVPPQSQYPVEYGLAPLAPGTPPVSAEPLPKSLIQNGRKYELRVVQQPMRARMCGFGDKDRRPITPPPCVRLYITDSNTGKEIDVNDIDHSMFVLNVDLWSADGSKPVHLVRHSPTSPSISATTPVSYQNPEATAAYSNTLPGHYSRPGEVKYEPRTPTQPFHTNPNNPTGNQYGQPQQQHQQPQSYYNSAYPPSTNGPQQYPQNGYQSHPNYRPGQNEPQPGGDYPQPQQLPSTNQLASYGGRPYQQTDQPTRPVVTTSQPTGMYTRNLIGSLSASAFRLCDPHDHIGIWFVLQDLSVRTEGHFRLRFSFVNVGIPPPAQNPSDQTIKEAQPPPPTIARINKGKAAILAACFSDEFQVYSAKRFPGVVESTPLSKCFATQGIKIPIRKDGAGKGGRNNDDYDDE